MNAVEMSQDFGVAIINSDEYQAFQKAQDNLDNNKDAQELIQEFQQKQMEVYQTRQRGEEVTGEAVDAVKGLQDQMLENENIKEYLVAKQNYEKFMAAINRNLMKSVGLVLGEAGSSGSSGGCDCSSCG
ncbi:YlbF family regulator [Candidatus Contubernalis alkaliaceticus]|uniref:YlbF family regulator n=1 Tax=Candidatus Contubernalis alkaliaceticus TaxID=338645 RepID=UPI001F4C294F|nr:YlbF family regulator [Candidatus Contubernalis alkalaceticus]UNC91427.1 YlbF family regulator [Candidatus Contubernalis alkalaceticus]